MRDLIVNQLKESAQVKLKTAELLSGDILRAVDMIVAAYRKGGKILLIGNGGSAADAQHIAGELVWYLIPASPRRRGIPALALTSSSSIITAIGNDHDYHEAFARKVEAFATHPEDILIAISTSGTSKNIIRAVEVAHEVGIKVIGLTGKGGGNLKDMADLALVVPSDSTQRVQESHLTIGHIICDLIEKRLSQSSEEKPSLI